MTPIPKTDAHALGLVPFTNPFRLDREEALLATMFADISKRHPQAQIVQETKRTVVIYVPASLVRVPRQDNPKALRGDYPKLSSIVGRVGR
jgi:hypothetical protein